MATKKKGGPSTQREVKGKHVACRPVGAATRIFKADDIQQLRPVTEQMKSAKEPKKATIINFHKQGLDTEAIAKRIYGGKHFVESWKGTKRGGEWRKSISSELQSWITYVDSVIRQYQATQ